MEKQNKELRTFVILGLALELFFIIILFVITFNQHLQIQDLNKDVNNTKEDLSIYWHPFEEKGFFNNTINGILVYSDVNNFTRIENLMGEVNITNESYYGLNWIVYYQNLIGKNYEKDYKYGRPTYFEHNSEISCDGYYLADPPQIGLYRCDGIFGERLNVSIDEKFILLHELGHFVYETNYTREQAYADEYAKDKLNEGKFFSSQA